MTESVVKSEGAEGALPRDWVVSRVPFFYGWVMLPIVLMIQVASAPGQTFGVSVFNPYIRRALNLSHSEISGAYMLGTFLASLPMIYVGALMDRHGPRRILVGVVLLFGLACVGLSQATGLVTVFLSFLMLRMLAQGSMGLLTANTLAMWFNARLGFAAGIMTAVGAVSMGGIPTLNLWLIQSFGWRWGYAILGMCVWLTVMPLLAFLFRNKPEDVGQRPDGLLQYQRDSVLEHRTNARKAGEDERRFTLSEALRTRAYWIMAAAAALPAMIVTGIHFHAVQIYLDSGLTEADAAVMFTTFALAFAGLMFLGGVLADRLPLNLLLSISMAGLVGGIVMLIQVSSIWTSHLFATVLGGGQGILMAVRATLWVRYYGRPHLGKIRGSLVTIEVAASSTGPFLMGAAHDMFGGYHEVFWLFAVISVPMIGLALLATRPECRLESSV